MLKNQRNLIIFFKTNGFRSEYPQRSGKIKFIQIATSLQRFRFDEIYELKINE
jgi:hypothetical protein